MTQALSIQQRSVPQVVEGRCVLTVDQPPPCPKCGGDGIDGRGSIYDPPEPCPTCDGSGQAPPGTEIIVWVPGRAVWTVEQMYRMRAAREVEAFGYRNQLDPVGEPGKVFPAAVVLAGKLGHVAPINHEQGISIVGYSVTLVSVVVLPQPITEWTRTAIDHHGEPVTGSLPVASLPESWSVAPQALLDAIKEQT